jgi:hypothetical protein
MRDFLLIDGNATILYTVDEKSTKRNPLYLQDLLIDLPFDQTALSTLTLRITVPHGRTAYIIDDLHFVSPSSNTIELILQESSLVQYTLFVANHALCAMCNKKDFFGCQSLPSLFEKKILVDLQEPMAQAHIKCHYLGDETSEFSLTTTQHHRASSTTSKLVVKGVLDDSAKLISNNTIIVDKNVKAVVAEQSNKNLMLSSKARAISIPQLAINSESVSCKHGVTVSSINKDELFYLQSRGLVECDAERLLIEAFLR